MTSGRVPLFSEHRHLSTRPPYLAPSPRQRRATGLPSWCWDSLSIHASCPQNPGWKLAGWVPNRGPPGQHRKLHGENQPEKGLKDWQVASPLGITWFLQFFRLVSSDYGKPRWLMVSGKREAELKSLQFHCEVVTFCSRRANSRHDLMKFFKFTNIKMRCFSAPPKKSAIIKCSFFFGSLNGCRNHPPFKVPTFPNKPTFGWIQTLVGLVSW